MANNKLKIGDLVQAKQFEGFTPAESFSVNRSAPKGILHVFMYLGDEPNGGDYVVNPDNVLRKLGYVKQESTKRTRNGKG